MLEPKEPSEEPSGPSAALIGIRFHSHLVLNVKNAALRGEEGAGLGGGPLRP